MGIENDEDEQMNTEELGTKRPPGTAGEYNIPKRFPYIIKQLSRLQTGEIPTRCRGTLINTKMLVTRKGLWLLGDGMYCRDVSGVLAGRFCNRIFDFMDCLEILAPSKRKELLAFRGWLRVEGARYDEEQALVQLKQEAMERGYVLRKA